MLRNIRSKLLIVALVAAFVTVVAGVRMKSDRLTIADGLVGNTVNDIWQDNEGFMWFATKNGISRYDGYSMVNFTRHTNIGSLIGDLDDGILWCAGSTYHAIDLRTYKYVNYVQADSTTTYQKFVLGHHGLWVYDKDHGARFIYRQKKNLRFRNFNVENKTLASNSVNRIHVSDDGKAWISTDKGIYMVDTLSQVHCLQAGINSPHCMIWGDGIYFFDRNQNIRVFNKKGVKLSTFVIPARQLKFSDIKDIFSWNGLMVFITKSGFYTYRPGSRAVMPFQQYAIKEGKLLDQFDGNFFIQDKDYNLFIFDKKGKVNKLSLISNAKFSHAHSRKYRVRQGKEGKFLIATYGNGLYVYNPVDGQLEHFQADDEKPLIASNFIERLFVDRQGSVWLNEAFLGLSYISYPRHPEVDFAFAGNAYHGDWSNCVSMLMPTKNGEAMVSTRDNKLYRLDAQTHQLHFVKNLNAPAYCYYEDAQGHSWLGTRGDGLYVDGVRYATDEPLHQAPCDDFLCIVSDKRGNIWLGTPNYGLVQARLDNGKLKFRQYLRRSYYESFISDMDVDGKGNLWIGTSNGLYMLPAKTKHITDDSFIIYNVANKSFPFDEVVLVKCTDDGFIWTSANGKGLWRCRVANDGKLLKTQGITMKEGLANNNVNSVVDDHNGKLWVSTDNGLSIVYKNDLKAKTYPFSQTAEQNITVSRCGALLSDHIVAFGSLYGVALLDTRGKLRQVKTNVSPSVTDLLVNGRSILANDDMPDFKNGLQLSHTDNTLLFRFSNFDYTAQRHNLYQCYMEGIDETWREATSVNSVEFSNLSPGTYVFHVRALNADNCWGKETTFKVTILHPWYATWWAWLIYLAVIAVAIWYVWKNWKEKFDLRQEMKMEKQVTEFRINFFTHITHEFRTPLAIIQNAVDKIVSPDGQQVSRSNVQTARRGTRRLLRLVNQLMEFRRISTSNLRLEVERADIIDFVRDIYQDFWIVAKQKEQTLNFTPFDRKYYLLFDKHIVETVVYNLLSNAVKYTPAKGVITFEIKKKQDGLHLICKDNGPGISKKQQQELFQPFMHGYVSQGGMGIGLYTAHEMARKHHGELSLLRTETSEKEQTGSVFDFRIPLDEALYAPDEYRTSQAISTEKQENEQTEIIIQELNPQSLNRVHVAIIEDNPNMMAQLKAELGAYFVIDAYMEGKSGYEGICANRPALIICDVMLPDMNGYDIVRKLKKSEEFFDIPVIMLTALDDDAHKLKGYEAGADDYMVKPCNNRLLVARTVQLITWYRKFKSSKTEEVKVVNPVPKVETIIWGEGGKEEKIVTSIADRNFITKMQSIVAQHIGEKDFTVDQMAAQMCMGRTKFYGKVKELLGVSPNKYISNERMRIAGELILEGELNVSEVGYKVGILDPSYFNKCFKAYYGCVPSKYGK